MPRPTKEQIADLEAKHKRISVVDSSFPDDTGEPAWTVILRRPSSVEWKTMKGISNNPQLAGPAGPNERFFRMLAVHPDPATDPAGLEALLDEWPGIPEACAQYILVLAGGVGATRGKG